MRIIKQPLLHFLVLGCLLFGLYEWIGDKEETETERQEIVVTLGRIEAIAANFRKVWQRDPTMEELDGLVQDFINEEVYYREALAIGLDRNDTIVRRRLRQKIEFITADLSDQIEPTDAELDTYYQAHAEAYLVEPVYTFHQVYLNPDERGEAMEEDVASLLTTLNNSASDNNLEELGDRIMLESTYEALSQFELERLFGKEFSAEMGSASTGAWQGPLRSGYGLHLVKIDTRTAPRSPALGEVRERVSNDWKTEKHRESNELFLQELREQYTITIEDPDAVEHQGTSVARTPSSSLEASRQSGSIVQLVADQCSNGSNP